MVVAFEGWNDAGEAASLALDHLAGLWDAEVVATIDAEEFYDFTVARPEVGLDEHDARYILWPDPEVLASKVPGSDHDLVLLRGIEPHMRWRTFSSAVVEIARDLEVEIVVLLGALLADVPHSRPARVSGASDDPRLSEIMGLVPSSYEGPTGIVGVLYDALHSSGTPAASLWASVPHYVHQVPSPKAVVALLERLSVILGTTVDPGELTEAARQYEQEVDDQISDDAETVAYVSELEEVDDAESAQSSDGASAPITAEGGGEALWGVSVPSEEAHIPGAEALAAEVEEFLREHRSGG